MEHCLHIRTQCSFSSLGRDHGHLSGLVGDVFSPVLQHPSLFLSQIVRRHPLFSATSSDLSSLATLTGLSHLRPLDTPSVKKGVPSRETLLKNRYFVEESPVWMFLLNFNRYLTTISSECSLPTSVLLNSYQPHHSIILYLECLLNFALGEL